MLKYDPHWRFKPPPDGDYFNSSIPPQAIDSFSTWITKITFQGDRWSILERFKAAFGSSLGQTHYPSSSEGWAEIDLNTAMSNAAANAPMFLEAFYTVCKELIDEGLFAPDYDLINTICETNTIGYRIDPPNLILRESVNPISTRPIPVDERPPTLAQQALNLIDQSLDRSERLLAEGRGREAVQESLWILESMTTSFKGIPSSAGEIQGQYFNEIMKSLKLLEKGTTFARAIEWLTSLHGYLSSPTGGGIRHGIDLTEGAPILPSEARLFCNLIRSFMGYLLSEYERLTDKKFGVSLSQ